MKKLRILVAALVLGMVGVLAGVAGAVGVFAEGETIVHSFSLSPMSQKIVLIPGETYEGAISVSNPANSEENFSYIVELAPYSVSGSDEDGDGDDYGDYSITEETDETEITNWITLKNETGTLAPNESATVSFIIDVPEDAPAGGQYAALLVREDVSGYENTSGITEIMQMVSIIYATVAGDSIETGSISENNVPAILFNNVLEATSMVENQGNVHTDAEYVLQVWPLGSDEEICTNEEAAETTTVLPSTKKYHTTSCTLTTPGFYTVRQTVTIFGAVSEVERTVFYCPIWMLLIILFVVALIVIWILVGTTKRKKERRAV